MMNNDDNRTILTIISWNETNKGDAKKASEMLSNAIADAHVKHLSGTIQDARCIVSELLRQECK